MSKFGVYRGKDDRFRKEYAEGGAVTDPSQSLNPLNRILGLGMKNVDKIGKPPEKPQNFGPNKDQGGPQKGSQIPSDNDDA